MILFLQQGLLSDRVSMPVAKLCAWFDLPQRTVYSKPVKSPPRMTLRRGSNQGDPFRRRCATPAGQGMATRITPAAPEKLHHVRGH